MEIERKFLIAKTPDNLDSYPSHVIEQAYLCTAPVVRIRKRDDDYILTYKSAGLMCREEAEHPLTKEAYAHLLEKADYNVITKRRYKIPEKDNLTIELDIFDGLFKGLVIAEVEFPDVESANAYVPPSWFTKEVTNESTYHNSTLSQMESQAICELLSQHLK